MSITKSIILLLAIPCIFSFSVTKDKKPPKITRIVFGEIQIDGTTYEKDVVIEGGEVRERKKGPSKPFKNGGHTPLTVHESIPWDCDILVIGIGMSNRLPVTDEFKELAEDKGVELILLKTPEATKYFMKNYNDRMNAIFHITC